MMKRTIFLIAAILSFTFVFAEIPNRPNPPRLVNDFAKVLTSKEQQKLEGSLEQFARETSTQIVVVTVSDLEGYDPGDYAVRLGEKWGVGQKGKSNGLVILLKPKTVNSSGQIFIATGYGLEGVLPDAVVNGTIVDSEMIPSFKQNDYFGGLSKGINVIMDITRGEYTADYYYQQHHEEKKGGIFPAAIFFLLFFVIFPILRFRRKRFYSPGRSLPFWLAIGMMSGSRSHGGSFGNFSSGGGGFGGFGGGSFGGGGAGGSW